MPLDRKRIIYIGSAIGVVLVTALLGYAYRTQLIGVFDNAPALATDNRTELQIQEELGVLIQTGSFDECKKINDAYYETVCINNIALALADEKLDVSFCQKIDNKLIPIIECERQVVMKKSIEREDMHICDEATDSGVREQCRTSFAIGLALKKNDIRACEQEATPERRTECADMFLFQTEFLADPSKFTCSKFREEDVRTDCVAFSKQDLSQGMGECSTLKTDLFINQCMTQVLIR